MKKRTLCLLIGVALLFSSCATFKLTRQLDKPLRGWLELHQSIMGAKVPKWLDERGGTEKGHFLRLSKEMQEKYMSMFWDMREEELEGIFKDRIDTANRQFGLGGKEGWRTDRGYILLACGEPQFMRQVTVSDMLFDFRSNPRNRGRDFITPDHDFDGTVYYHWDYYWRSMGVQFIFKYSRSGYYLYYGGITTSSNHINFMDYSRKLFAPTEDGWYLWGNTLLEWVKKQEKK